MLHHFTTGIEHLIILRQGHRITGSAHTGGNNGNRIDRLHIRQHMKQDCMTGLMVGRDPFLLVGNHLAALFRTDSYLNKCSLNIALV